MKIQDILDQTLNLEAALKSRTQAPNCRATFTLNDNGDNFTLWLYYGDLYCSDEKGGYFSSGKAFYAGNTSELRKIFAEATKWVTSAKTPLEREVDLALKRLAKITEWFQEDSANPQVQALRESLVLSLKQKSKELAHNILSSPLS